MSERVVDIVDSTPKPFKVQTLNFESLVKQKIELEIRIFWIADYGNLRLEKYDEEHRNLERPTQRRSAQQRTTELH